MHLFELPLEPIETRYTMQWRYWMHAALDVLADEQGSAWSRIDAGPLAKPAAVAASDFLDPLATNEFKANQGANLVRQILVAHRANPQEQLRVFLHDLWHPVVTQLLYLRDVGKVPLWIGGILHAGSYVYADHMSFHSKWARGIEAGWLAGIDLIVVGTKYHKQLVNESFSYRTGQLMVMPFPVSVGAVAPSDRDTMVVFPHRLSPEKDPMVFDELMNRVWGTLPSVTKCRTIEVANNKAEYYDLLYRGKVAFSSAVEETFGIAMIEATTRGCIPLVPDRLAYPEQYPSMFRYNSVYDAGRKCVEFISDYNEWATSAPYVELVQKFCTLHRPDKAAMDIARLMYDVDAK